MNTYINNNAVWLILVAQSACSAGDPGSIPRLEWSPGEENGIKDWWNQYLLKKDKIEKLYLSLKEQEQQQKTNYIN